MIYAMGDIHGQREMLDTALALIEADGGPEAEIVFLGDYTDRGPDSRGVLDRLIEGRDAGRPWRFVMGNHDRMFLRFVTEAKDRDRGMSISWMNPRAGGPTTLASYGLGGTPAFLHPHNGGRETLASYEIDGDELTGEELSERLRKAVPPEHMEFLAGCETMIPIGPLLFVHAGIRPGVPLARQREDDLLWIRDGFLEDDRDYGHLVVHGHTALDMPAHFGNRVDLDGGAGYFRPLIPAAFDGRDCWLLTGQGREPLLPPE